MFSPPKNPPELLSPAGDWDCARAAVENGADAVYFGLQGGFNARARAANFHAEELPKLLAFLHRHGVRGYLTLNTLVFADELSAAEAVARQAVAAGVDAVLVQDLGLLRLLHRLCPKLPLHASTQMTLTSAEYIGQLDSLGVRRVVLPRELSIEQIADVHRQSDVELEAFVHGALCMSYSGQCLASLSLGGRSANRGQCAQPCRLPYEIIANGPSQNDASRVKYPMSPRDLAAYDRLPQLLAAGVSAFKIEGRLKPPEYVATVTHHYRTALDAAMAESQNTDASNEPNSRRLTASGSAVHQLTTQDIAELDATFSRGFCRGWLDGDRPQSLVSGESSAKRGILLGEVRGVRGERIAVELSAPVQRGDGLVFEGDRSRANEQGGRVYEVFQNRRSIEKEVASGTVELAFRYGAIDLGEIALGQKVWKTDDPRAARRMRQTYTSGRLQRRVPLDLTIEAAVGKPLLLVAVAATGISCRLQSPEALPEAKKHPITVELLTEQFGRLGGTPYELRNVDARLDGRAMIPLSELGKLRHEMTRRLDAAAATPPDRTMFEGSALAAERHEAFPTPRIISPAKQIHVLCRSIEQLEAAAAAGVSSVTADFKNLRQCGDAVQTARSAGVTILLATPRIHKPGESDVFESLADCSPDGFLVRNLAAIAFFRNIGLPIVADFSLNAANDLAVAQLCSLGVERVTAAYDLDFPRLLELASLVPPDFLEVVVHRNTPLFHSEHCIFYRTFSSGDDRANCGRPCERHTLRLRDRKGVEHFVAADSQCRNTLFHGEAESMANRLSSLLAAGLRHFRVELPPDGRAETVATILAAYRS
jgi:putative protease